MDSGGYQYLALEQKLGIASQDNRLSEKIMSGCMGQKVSAATFIWVADVERMTWRYGERGYRYILLDAGHICQNLINMYLKECAHSGKKLTLKWAS